jgi:hypothetical protein
MEAGDWIALAALVIAIWVGVAHYRLEKLSGTRQLDIQGRIAAIEEAKRDEELANRAAARVVCEKREEPRSNGTIATLIVFRNDGAAAARDVWFEREPLSSLISGSEDARFPRLMPGQEWKILADPTFGLPDRIAFRFGWSDDAGTHEEDMVYSVYT